MTRADRRLAWLRPGPLAALGLAIALVACRSAHLAEVVEQSGTVERDHADHVGRWWPSAPGERLRIGDGLRTGVAASAMLRLRSRARLQVEAETLIRFVDGAPERDDFQVELGEVVLEAAEAPLTLGSALGPIVLQGGTRVRIGAADQIVRYEVEVGTATFADQDRTVTLGPAQRIAVDIATASLIPFDEPAPVAAEDAPGTAAAATRVDDEPGTERDDSATAALTPQPGSRGPEVPDLTVAAGESAVIHDPSPPTAVALALDPPCAGEGRLTVDGRRASVAPAGTARAVVALLPGQHRYELRCAERTTSGTLHVLRDPGTARLPRRPPTTFVDTDGRKYTVLYQNMLPEIQVAWPNAPRADRYLLRVALPGGKVREVETRAPRHRFAAGQIPEGDHVLAFATASGEPRSPDTALKLRFDNAAPTAVVNAPRNLAFRPGEPVQVAGIALPGWIVSATGGSLSLDEQHRFSGQAATPSGHGALAIRFVHADRGVHYYLRRARRGR